MTTTGTTLRCAIAVAFLLAFAVGSASAQKPPEAENPQKAESAPAPLESKACAGDRRATVGSTGKAEMPPSDKTLSEKLAATEGVICPPAELDPDIRVPAPGGGAMRVIPPPGSPGGDQSVRPK